jgi:hypothetical protein
MMMRACAADEDWAGAADQAQSEKRDGGASRKQRKNLHVTDNLNNIKKRIFFVSLVLFPNAFASTERSAPRTALLFSTRDIISWRPVIDLDRFREHR